MTRPSIWKIVWNFFAAAGLLMLGWTSHPDQFEAWLITTILTSTAILVAISPWCDND